MQEEQTDQTEIQQLVPASSNVDEQNYTILLVDDNYDFLDFLSACLSTSYNVLKATNGQEALEILKTENVDIVISDVMMPKMNGLELCTAIKSDLCISHIPIILLTAKASEEYQLEGLKYGERMIYITQALQYGSTETSHQQIYREQSEKARALQPTNQDRTQSPHNYLPRSAVCGKSHCYCGRQHQ